MKRAILVAVIAAWFAVSCGGRDGAVATQHPLAARLSGLTINHEHSFGVTKLLRGDHWGAVALLTEAAALGDAQPIGPQRKAAVLNDLAAAHAETASFGEAKNLIIGLDVAERAWELDRTPPIAWTRAVLLSTLASDTTASKAWDAYLALRPLSREAKRRRESARRRGSNIVADVSPIVVERHGYGAIEQYDRLIDVLTSTGDRDRAALVLLLRAETLDEMGAADEAWGDLFKARKFSAARTVIEALAVAAARDGHMHAARVLLDDAMTGADDRTFARLSAWREVVQVLIERGPLGVHVLSPRHLLSAEEPAVVHVAAHGPIPRKGTSSDLLHDSAAAAMVAQSFQRLYETDSRIQIANGSPMAALWFSDRARRAAVPLRERSSCVGDPRGASAETMGQRLARCVPDGVTLVQQDLDPENLNTWVVRDGQIVFTTTPVSASRLRSEIEQFIGDIEGGASSVAVRKQAKNLYDILIEPVAQQIAGANLLVYSPSLNLRGMPIGMLHDGDVFLVQRHSVMTTTTISVFQLPRELAPSASALIMLPTAAPRVRELIGARREAREVRQIYGPRAMLVTGDAATPETFLEDATNYDVLHLPSHGYPSDVPYQNGIDFGPRRIRAYDVFQLRLGRTPVVMLAACRTATQTGGPANLSLADAFLAAGASAVVGSLWNVDDTHTADLAIAFHRELSRGVAPQDALRSAQMQFIRRGMPPSAWAAFQVSS